MHEYYPGSAEEGYNFSQCLSRDGLWFVQSKDSGKLIRPRDAKDDDLVFVDFFRVELYALRHMFRDGVYESISWTNEPSFREYLEKRLKAWAELIALTKKRKTPVPDDSGCWMTWGRCVRLICSDGPVGLRRIESCCSYWA